MGKDFKKELSNLEKIYASAQEVNIDYIAKFLNKYCQNFFYAVGSGGSYSVARIFEYMCTKAGWFAKSVTPLELQGLAKHIQKSACVLFTASGRNADSKNAYNFLEDMEPDGLLTCCMRENAPIKKLQRNNLHNYFFEYDMPIKKDGYLAVESLISSLVLMSRAFEKATGNSFFTTYDEPEWNKNYEIEFKNIKEVLRKETIIVLHSGISTPAAVDLESKFSEVALGNIQLVDFRNFAHGRHFWLSNRKDTTAVLAMVGTTEKSLADRTLALIPEWIPVVRKDVSDTTIEGLFELLSFIFNLVLIAGELKNINPGMPHVEPFGKKMYHLNYNIRNNEEFKLVRKNVILAAAYRKKSNMFVGDTGIYDKMAASNYKRLIDQKFRGIIFDYDGTLHDKNEKSECEIKIFERINSLLEKGIHIGIATGRGKSVKSELRNVILEKFWKEIPIAYYNGGCMGMLSDDIQPDKKLYDFPKEFVRVKEYLESLEIRSQIKIDGIDDRNPYQLTIIYSDNNNINPYLDQIRAFVQGEDGVKILESSHSIDIIPKRSSKNNIFEYYRRIGVEQDEFLKVGDSGIYGGNDYELLSTDFGLSVDSVSFSSNTCWNYAPLGTRNLEATLYYLDQIEVVPGEGFKLRR